MNTRGILNTQDESTQMYLIHESKGRSIRYLKNPTHKACLQAVRYDATCISFIDNPSEEVQLEAINNESRAFACINHPCDTAQLLWLKYNWCRNNYEFIMLAYEKEDEQWFKHQVNKHKLENEFYD